MANAHSFSRRLRLLAVLGSLLGALAVSAVPTYAAGGKSVGASIAPGSTACTYRVTMTWSGYSGTTAYLRVVYPAGGLALAAAAINVPVSGRSGTVSAELTVPSGTGFHSYYGRGTLYNRRDQPSSPEATSSTSISATC
jgi:hypothetical protein